MSKFNFLINHAVLNVWCSPGQDLQAIIKPAKLTQTYGVVNTVVVQATRIDLPVKNKAFHVYQIGQLNPKLINIIGRPNKWISMSSAMNAKKLIVDIYAGSGIEMPRYQVWYRITKDMDLVVAIQFQPKIPINLDKEDIFVRFYSNQVFHQARNSPEASGLYTEGRTINSTDDILAIQNSFNTYNSKTVGATYAFVNGYKVSVIDMITVKIGDLVEFVYDSSIYKVVDFKISDLQPFTSTLDNKQKFLLHYPKDGTNEIDYQDDIDMFLYQSTIGGRHKGIFHHKNASNKDAMRMVTHVDYAVVPEYITAFINGQGWTDPTNIFLRLHIRKAGWDGRPLVNEAARINELYKLNDADIVGAMVGINSVVPNWTAAHLESDKYTEIMRSPSTTFSATDVQDAYGYNAISKLLADTPEFTYDESGQRVANMPYNLINRCVGYEYDSDGLLLGYFPHNGTTTYVCGDDRAELVEMITGINDFRLDETYGTKVVGLDSSLDYRMYKCPIINGQPTNVWQDVTGSGNYNIINNVLTWLIDQTQWYTLVRSDKIILAYDLDLPSSDGLMKFSLQHEQLRGNEVSTWTMQVPMGELTLFMNGHSMIEGLDYVVKFPQIIISNKEYLIDPENQTQKITIRFTGFCKNDLSRETQADFGFVDHALLSQNNRFDLRDDKVLRIIVDGKYYDRSELLFSESNSGVSAPDARNGAPYQITDIVVPMRGQTTDNTYVLREIAQATDLAVSNYMTTKIPEPVFDTDNVINQLYVLYSPFFCKIMYDLINGNINDPRIKQHYNDEDVFDICQPYEYILGYDPTQDENLPDLNYVSIHPHNQNQVVEIDIYYYQFLARVVRLYLKNRVVLSNFLRLKPIS